MMPRDLRDGIYDVQEPRAFVCVQFEGIQSRPGCRAPWGDGSDALI